MGLWGAVSIGIGGMVGGGIFAVLGLSVEIAKGGAPIALTHRTDDIRCDSWGRRLMKSRGSEHWLASET